MTFLPQDLADHNDVLKLDHSDPTTAVISVPLHGQAQSGPNIGGGPRASTLAPHRRANAISTLKVSNTGTGTLTVSALSSNNAHFVVIAPAVPFMMTSDAPPVIVVVGFIPRDDREQLGRLSITSNDPDLPTVPITLEGRGRGGVPNITVNQSTLNFGSVCVGQK